MTQERLELGRRLATGGMAEVYAARLRGAEGFTRDVVVKRVLPQLAKSPTFRARFIAEARLCAGLRHPCIAPVYELVADGDELMMIVEWVDGIDLRGLLNCLRAAGQLMPRRAALKVMADVADALACAHEATDDRGRPRGIVHRDVTPSNVLVGRRGEVKLIDFGIASADDGARLTTPGVVMGKGHYLAPEQLRGEVATAQVDLWACGVIFFEMLAGERPFRGKPPLLLDDILAAERADVRTFAGVREGEARVVDACLARPLAERTASARALARALDELWDGATARQGQQELLELVERFAPPAPREPTLVRADGALATMSAAADAAHPDPPSVVTLRPETSLLNEPAAADATAVRDAPPAGHRRLPPRPGAGPPSSPRSLLATVEGETASSEEPATARGAPLTPSTLTLPPVPTDVFGDPEPLSPSPSSEPSSSFASVPTVSVPTVSVPTVSVPTVSVPTVSVPTVSLPPPSPAAVAPGAPLTRSTPLRDPPSPPRMAAAPPRTRRSTLAATIIGAGAAASVAVAGFAVIFAAPSSPPPAAASAAVHRAAPPTSPAVAAPTPPSAPPREPGLPPSSLPSSSPSPPPSSPSGEPTPSPVAPVAPVASTPGEPPARRSPTSAAKATTRPSLPARAPGRSPPERRGTLIVDSRPYGVIVVDGVARGETPLRLEVDAGRHVVELSNPTTGQRRRVVVDVTAGAPTRVREVFDAP